MAGGDPGQIVNGGFQPVFTREEEDQLRRYLLDASEIFLGLSFSELRSLAYDLAKESKKKHPFSRINQKAGYEWVRNFIRRNPEISIRTPQATSFYRARGFSREKVKIFFDNLKNVLDRHSFQPAQIFNMDETGFSSVMSQVKVIARRGAKQVGRITSAEKRQLVTAVYCCNANGDYIPPMLIIPGKKYSPEMIRDAPDGTIGTCTPSGWSNQETFLAWLQHFAEHSNAGSGNPVLLILDNSGTHLKADAIDFCRSRCITMLSLPPHTSHRLQPLDVSVFKPMKMRLKVAEQAWMSHNVLRVITRKELPLLFSEAYMASATRNNAFSGFRKTGIWPFNPNIFTDADFAPSVPFQVCADEDDEDTIGPADNITNRPAASDANRPADIDTNRPAGSDANRPADDDTTEDANNYANGPAGDDFSGPADGHMNGLPDANANGLVEEHVDGLEDENANGLEDENANGLEDENANGLEDENANGLKDENASGIADDELNMQVSDDIRMQASDDVRMEASDHVRMQTNDEIYMQAYDFDDMKADECDNMQADDSDEMQASEDANMQADDDRNMKAKDDAMMLARGMIMQVNDEDENEPADDDLCGHTDEAGANFLRLISEPRCNESLNSQELRGSSYPRSSVALNSQQAQQLTRRRSPRCHPTHSASPYKIRPLPKANSHKRRKGGRAPLLSRILTDPQEDSPTSEPKNKKRQKKQNPEQKQKKQNPEKKQKKQNTGKKQKTQKKN